MLLAFELNQFYSTQYEPRRGAAAVQRQAGMSFSDCSSRSSSWAQAATVTSGGIFVGTALLSQWWERRRRRQQQQQQKELHCSFVDGTGLEDKERNGDGGVGGNSDLHYSMESYMKRRMEDRLSFHEFDRQPPDGGDCDDGSESEGSYEGDYRASAEEDIYPTNNNWNHFEGYQYDEDYRREVKPKKKERKKVKVPDLNRRTSFGSDCDESLDKMLEGDDLKEGDEAYLRQSSDEVMDASSSLALQNSFLVGTGRSMSNESNSNIYAIASQHRFSAPSTHKSASLGPSSTSRSSILFRNSASLDERVFTANTVNESPMPQISVPPKLRRRTLSVPELASEEQLLRIDNDDAVPTTASNLVRNRAAVRTLYNASIMPNKLILIRHGQSLGNIDESLYATTPDNAMPLTELGWEQAREAGRQLKQTVLSMHGSSRNGKGGESSVHFILSPYVRTVETFHGIASAWCDPAVFEHIVDRERRLKAWYGRLLEMGLTWNEDPRIREQDFGNYQEPDRIKQAKRDRYRFGAFYYRFPYGESASDVSMARDTMVACLACHSKHHTLTICASSIRSYRSLTEFRRF